MLWHRHNLTWDTNGTLDQCSCCKYHQCCGKLLCNAIIFTFRCQTTRILITKTLRFQCRSNKYIAPSEKGNLSTIFCRQINSRQIHSQLIQNKNLTQVMWFVYYYLRFYITLKLNQWNFFLFFEPKNKLNAFVFTTFIW